MLFNFIHFSGNWSFIHFCGTWSVYPFHRHFLYVLHTNTDKNVCLGEPAYCARRGVSSGRVCCRGRWCWHWWQVTQKKTIFVNIFWIFFVSLLSSHIESFSVSYLRDFPLWKCGFIIYTMAADKISLKILVFIGFEWRVHSWCIEPCPTKTYQNIVLCQSSSEILRDTYN